jgi:class 3 adenylate cyclase
LAYIDARRPDQMTPETRYAKSGDVHIAYQDSVGALGLTVRAGLHTGECEVHEGKLAGIAVNIAARIASQPAGDEVLVSSTVKDLVVGSDIAFTERGPHELKGVPGEWRLFAVGAKGGY